MSPRTIRVKADIEVPRVPNFLLYDGGKMRVGDVSDDDLKRIAEAWARDLLARAREQRQQEREREHVTHGGHPA